MIDGRQGSQALTWQNKKGTSGKRKEENTIKRDREKTKASN